MTAVGQGRVPHIPLDVWRTVARSSADEAAVVRALAKLPADARRGFYACLLLIARRATIEELAAGFRRLPAGPVVTPDPDELTPLVAAPVLCGYCRQPLPPPASTGRPRLYHDPCAIRQASLVRAERRAGKVSDDT